MRQRDREEVATRGAIAIVGLLTILSLTLRTVIASGAGIWRDEALLLAVVDLPSWSEMIAYLRLHESHPPLFYAIMRVWRLIFGETDSAALMLPIVTGAALVPLVFAIGRKLFDIRTGTVAAALVTVLPSLNDDGSAVRPYSLLALLVVVCCYAAVRALQDGSLWRWSGYGISLALLIYCHNWGWVVMGGTTTAVLAYSLWGSERELRSRRLKGASLALAIMGLTFLPWAGVLIDQSIHAGHPGIPVDSPQDALRLFLRALLALTTSTFLPALTSHKEIAVVSLVLAAAVFVLSYRRPGRQETDSAAFPAPRDNRIAVWVLSCTLFAATAIAIVLSPFSNLLVDRCFSVLSPVVALLIAYGATTFYQRRRAYAKLVPAAAAVLIVMLGVYAAGLYSLVTRPRTNVKEVADVLRKRHRAEDLVIITPGYLKSSVNHYLAGRPMRQIAYPDTGSSRLFYFSGVWKRLSDQGPLRHVAGEIAAARTNNVRIWLITDVPSRNISRSDSGMAIRGDWSAMAKVRTQDVRRMLFDAYGAPAWTSSAGPVFPRQELMIVELFQGSRALLPSAAQSRTSDTCPRWSHQQQDEAGQIDCNDS